MSVRIALFGQPRVLSSDGSVEYPLPRKTLNLLGYLILHRRRAPTRDSAAFALFPDDDEERARGNLRRNLSHLLAALPSGKDLVNTESERLAWCGGDNVHVDVIAFEEAVKDGRDDDALAEYSGDLLPTIYDEWTVPDRERLRDAYHEALARTIARQRSERNYDAASANAHRLLADDPWREDVVRLLMAIRYEAGDRAGALSTFERFAERLRDEMAADPMAETIALRDAALRGERLATSDAPRKPSDPPAEPALPFVGRDDAMERAHEAWRSAAEGTPSVLFVLGEAGVGKSRFATELARRAEREGGLVIRGYTSAGGEHRPYEAFVDALRGTPNLLDEHAGATLTDDRSARLRLFESVRKRLRALCHARPLVVVLEDLHWAGPSTIDLLEYVTDRLERSPVLFVATVRSEEMAGAHAIRALRRQLRGRGSSSDIMLGRLDARDATRAARSSLPESVDDEALARAVASVDGIPLLLVEAVRDLAAGRLSTASNIAALVGERLERLTPNAETALFFGATLGERFDLEAIEAATGWREDEALDAIGELIVGGLVRATARAPALTFAFTHDLIRVAATERMPDSDRVRAHGLLARALLVPAAGDAGAAAIARHFVAAGERARAAEQYRRAARYALGVFANEDARESASAGLALCDASDPSQRSLRYDLVDLREKSLARIGAVDERRADAAALVELAASDDAAALALVRLFEACIVDGDARAGVIARLAALAWASERAATAHKYALARDSYHRGQFAQARENALEAAAGFERNGEASSALRARIFALGALSRTGARLAAMEELERLRPVLDADEDLALRVEFHILAAVVAMESSAETAIGEARAALEMALRIGDRLHEARARQNLAVAASKLRRYDEALSEHELALAAYRDLGDEPQIQDELLNIAGIRVFCGEVDGRARALLEQVPDDGVSLWFAVRKHLIRGVIESHTGRASEAERSFSEALRCARELGIQYGRTMAERFLAGLLASQGRIAEARALIETAIRGCTDMGDPDIATEVYALSSRLLATAGDAAGARAHAERCEAFMQRERLDSRSESAWMLAAAYATIGDSNAASVLASEAAEAAVEDALRMPADLSMAYMALPWHQHAIAFLSGRKVPLAFGD